MSIDDRLNGLMAYMSDKGSESEFLTWQEIYEDICIYLSEQSDGEYIANMEDDGIMVVKNDGIERDEDECRNVRINFISVPKKDNDRMSDIFLREDEDEYMRYIGTLPTSVLDKMSPEEIFGTFGLEEIYGDEEF